MLADWQRGGFGIYVHWPFCAAKCPYCDFNSHVVDRVDQKRWRQALVSEIERVAAQVPERAVSTVFFGGGTPSLMPPETAEAVLEAIRANWAISNDLEVTLEANPTSSEAGKFHDFFDAGINRVSVGLQALNDADLTRLGRLHTAAEGRAAYDIARSIFPRVSFDLIYARQHQSLEAWKAELEDALSMDPNHMSLYQLTIEDGTAFKRRFDTGGLRGLPSEDLAADHYELTQDLCSEAGLPAYEISNHAVPGEEARHNLIYWRCGDYAGIGPGAHGRLTLPNGRVATASEPMPGRWISLVEGSGTGNIATDVLNLREQDVELLLMGLRTREGIDISRFQTKSKGLYNKISDLENVGVVDLSESTLRVTDKGHLLLNRILQELTSSL
ncbi:radical SAM family heme chaperone HemW [Aestuariibius insulae]|uniref:radical SAM family heme chaperone HemW n=1 Tax=Aestuariibius insulae TaxID=2058287 RepID=UPI00345E54B1